MQRKSWKSLPLAAALAMGGCSGSGNGSAIPDDGGAWMDGATVTVTRDPVAGRETVTLTNPQSGYSQVMSDEPLTPDANETDVPTAAAMALAAGFSR